MLYFRIEPEATHALIQSFIHPCGPEPQLCSIKRSGHHHRLCLAYSAKAWQDKTTGYWDTLCRAKVKVVFLW